MEERAGLSRHSASDGGGEEARMYSLTITLD
jgi:hypothetical protein